MVPLIISKGKYIRPKLGIRGDDNINQLVSAKLGITGVMILHVEPGSSADKAGLKSAQIDRYGNLQPGDIIQSFDEKTIKNLEDLLSILDKYKIGDEILITIWRDGIIKQIKVVLQ